MPSMSGVSSEELTFESFASRFRSAIRVGLNWRRFKKEKWPIEIVTIRSPEDYQRCFMPWYIGPDGREISYKQHGAVPMRVADVPKAVPLLNAERQGDIYEYVHTFTRQQKEIRFRVPTYGLPGDQYFVLDRNHRLSALTLIDKPFVVKLWNICGPIDMDCLLDLRYWVTTKH